MQINNPESIWRTEDQRFFAPQQESKQIPRRPLTVNHFTNNAQHATVIANYVIVNIAPPLPTVPENKMEQPPEPSCCDAFWNVIKCCRK